jgi:transposase
VERGGKPLVFVLTGGERHEQIALPKLLEGGAICRVGRGRPRQRPERLAGDKAYSSRTVRRDLRRRGIGAVIPTRKGERPNRHFDLEAYRECNRVERLINRLKQYRAIATRYEKLAVTYHALLTIAAILIWL